MNENLKRKLPLILVGLIVLIFVVLLVINETDLFDNRKTHTFDEAVDKQVGAGTLNMTEKDGQFVVASKNDVKQAMNVNNEKDNLNHMDISEKVPMSEKELNNILKDKGILFSIDENGNKVPPPNFDAMVKSRQQYLLQNNNPIELSDAVKYNYR